jgi:hypothetical protein
MAKTIDQLIRELEEAKAALGGETEVRAMFWDGDDAYWVGVVSVEQHDGVAYIGGSGDWSDMVFDDDFGEPPEVMQREYDPFRYD